MQANSKKFKPRTNKHKTKLNKLIIRDQAQDNPEDDLEEDHAHLEIDRAPNYYEDNLTYQKKSLSTFCGTIKVSETGNSEGQTNHRDTQKIQAWVTTDNSAMTQLTDRKLVAQTGLKTEPLPKKKHFWIFGPDNSKITQRIALNVEGNITKVSRLKEDYTTEWRLNQEAVEIKEVTTKLGYVNEQYRRDDKEKLISLNLEEKLNIRDMNVKEKPPWWLVNGRPPKNNKMNKDSENNLLRAKELANIDVHLYPDLEKQDLAKNASAKVHTRDRRAVKCKPRKLSVIQQAVLHHKANITIRFGKFEHSNRIWYQYIYEQPVYLTENDLDQESSVASGHMLHRARRLDQRNRETVK